MIWGLGKREMKSQCSVSRTFQFCQRSRVLEKNDGHTTSKIFDTVKLYTKVFKMLNTVLSFI